MNLVITVFCLFAVAVPRECLVLANGHYKRIKCPHGLASHEIAAIHLYTQECNFYHELNKQLRSETRDNLKPYFSYLRLLVSGLHKLPPRRGVVYRGMHKHLADTLPECKKQMPLYDALGMSQFIWWPCSSTSLDPHMLEKFAGTKGRRTVFTIEVRHARDIMLYSAFGSKEQELLLAPGTQLEVTNVADLGDVAMVCHPDLGFTYLFFICSHSFFIVSAGVSEGDWDADNNACVCQRCGA